MSMKILHVLYIVLQFNNYFINYHFVYFINYPTSNQNLTPRKATES